MKLIRLELVVFGLFPLNAWLQRFQRFQGVSAPRGINEAGLCPCIVGLAERTIGHQVEPQQNPDFSQELSILVKIRESLLAPCRSDWFGDCGWKVGLCPCVSAVVCGLCRSLPLHPTEPGSTDSWSSDGAPWSFYSSGAGSMMLLFILGEAMG